MIFTQTRIAALKCPPGRKDKLYFDDEQRGLGIRVTQGGKSYVAQYTFEGNQRRQPLGSCKAISLAQARAAVRIIMGDIARGVDPSPRHKQVRQDITLAVLLNHWHRLHLSNCSENYAVSAITALKRAFAPYIYAPATTLSRAMVVGVLDTLPGPMARQTAAYGRAMYGWAIKRGTLEINPFAHLPVAPAVERERTLSDDELVRIWRATDSLDLFDHVVRLLILVGQRRDEVAGLHWAELSDDLSIWLLPGTRAKNGRTHVIPLAEPVRRILREIPRHSEFVFSSRGNLPFHSFARPKRALDIKSGVTGWVLHDLRRSCATGLQRLGVRLEVTEAVLNHTGSRGGLIGTYQRHDYATEKKAALEAWAAYVEALVKLAPSCVQEEVCHA